MLFTIVIPCYNHGNFISNAIDSINKIAGTGIPYEIIIVDDGSTDVHTINVLNDLKSKGLNVITQKNSGPATARNNGIRAAQGIYILPLDCDDKLRVDYIIRAKEIFQSEPDISIVYSNFQTYGDKCFLQQYRAFNLQDLLIKNSVGAACIYKKEAWKLVGGYDVSFRQGWEDYDLYLNFAYHGLKYKHIDIIGYDYYIHRNSRERTFLKNNTEVNNTLDQLEKKYSGFLSRKTIHNHLVNQIRKTPFAMLIKIFFAVFLPSYYDKFVKSGKIKKYINM